MQIAIESHPLLRATAFLSTLPRPLGEFPAPEWLTSLLSLQAAAPLRSDDIVRAAVRDLLRSGGFKPTGRSKPASEYLLKAAADGMTTINAAVDACNVVSLHSGLPISVVDLDKAQEPFRIGLASEGTEYVFNASGQVIDVAKLICLLDAQGPCANAVKDAQRTKTSPSTTRTLSVIWGSRQLEERTATATAWYRDIIRKLGGTDEDVEITGPSA